MSDATPQDADEKTAAVPGDPRVRRWQIATALLLAVAIGLAFLAAIQVSQAKSDRDRDAAVRRAAAAMGTALVTYDYTDLDRNKADVLALATGTFARQYREGFGGLGELLTSVKANSEVRDAEVFLGDVGDDAATAIVVLDTVVSGTAGTNRSLMNYVQLDLVRTRKRWLVNAVTSLNLGQPADAASGAGAPTTTAAPNG